MNSTFYVREFLSSMATVLPYSNAKIWFPCFAKRCLRTSCRQDMRLPILYSTLYIRKSKLKSKAIYRPQDFSTLLPTKVRTSATTESAIYRFIQTSARYSMFLRILALCRWMRTTQRLRLKTIFAIYRGVILRASTASPQTPVRQCLLCGRSWRYHKARMRLL